MYNHCFPLDCKPLIEGYAQKLFIEFVTRKKITTNYLNKSIYKEENIKINKDKIESKEEKEEEIENIKFEFIENCTKDMEFIYQFIHNRFIHPTETGRFKYLLKGNINEVGSNQLITIFHTCDVILSNNNQYISLIESYIKIWNLMKHESVMQKIEKNLSFSFSKQNYNEMINGIHVIISTSNRFILADIISTDKQLKDNEVISVHSYKKEVGINYNENISEMLKKKMIVNKISVTNKDKGWIKEHIQLLIMCTYITIVIILVRMIK